MRVLVSPLRFYTEFKVRLVVIECSSFAHIGGSVITKESP